MADLEGPTTPPPLFPCSICNRTFLQETLERHSVACEKNASKKRKIFDSTKQRVQGTDLAEYLPVIVKSKKVVEKAPVKQSVSKWKEQHLEFVRAIRAARGVNDGLTEQEPAMSAITRPSNHEQCPTCERHFGPKAYDRHIEWCREKQARIPPKSNATTEAVMAKERLDARTKYRAPPLNKSRREITKEKYSVTRSGGGDTSTCVKKDQPQTTMPQISHTRVPRSLNDSSSPKETVSASSFRRTPHRSSYRQSSASPVKRPNVPTHIVPPKEPRVVRSRGVSPQKSRRDVKESSANKAPARPDKESPPKGERKGSKGDEFSDSIKVKGVPGQQSTSKKIEGSKSREMANPIHWLTVSNSKEAQTVLEDEQKIEKEVQCFKSKIPVLQLYCPKTSYENQYQNASTKIEADFSCANKLCSTAMKEIPTVSIKQKTNKVCSRNIAFPMKTINVSDEKCDATNMRPFNEKLRRDVFGKRKTANFGCDSNPSQGNSPSSAASLKKQSDVAITTLGKVSDISLCDDLCQTYNTNNSDTGSGAVDLMSRTYTICNSDDEVSIRSIDTVSSVCKELSLEDLISEIAPYQTPEEKLPKTEEKLACDVAVGMPQSPDVSGCKENDTELKKDGFLDELDFKCSSTTFVKDGSPSSKSSRKSTPNEGWFLDEILFKDWKAQGDTQNRCPSELTLKSNSSSEEAATNKFESEDIVLEVSTVSKSRASSVKQLELAKTRPCTASSFKVSSQFNSETKLKSNDNDNEEVNELDEKCSNRTNGSGSSIQISLEDIDDNWSEESDSVIYEDYDFGKHKKGDITMSLGGSNSSSRSALILELLESESESDFLNTEDEHESLSHVEVVPLNSTSKWTDIPEKCQVIPKCEGNADEVNAVDREELVNLQCLPMSTSSSEENLSGDSSSENLDDEDEITPCFKPILRYWGSNVDLSFEENKASMLPRLAYFKELKLKTFGKKLDEIDDRDDQIIPFLPESMADLTLLEQCPTQTDNDSTFSRERLWCRFQQESPFHSEEENDWFSSDDLSVESDNVVEIVTITRIDDGSKIDLDKFKKQVLYLPIIEKKLVSRHSVNPEKPPSETDHLVLPPINEAITTRRLGSEGKGTQCARSTEIFEPKRSNSNRSGFWAEQAKEIQKKDESTNEIKKPRPRTRILKTQQENSNFWMEQAQLIKNKESGNVIESRNFASWIETSSPQPSVLSCRFRDSRRVGSPISSLRSYKYPRRKKHGSEHDWGNRTSRSDSEEKYDPILSAKRQLMELLAHGEGGDADIVSQAGSPLVPSVLETSSSSAFSKYTSSPNPESETPTNELEFGDLIVTGHSALNLPSSKSSSISDHLESYNNIRDIAASLSSLSISSLDDMNLQNGNAMLNNSNAGRNRRNSKYREKLENAALSLRRSVSLFHPGAPLDDLDSEIFEDFDPSSDNENDLPNAVYPNPSFSLSSLGTMNSLNQTPTDYHRDEFEEERSATVKQKMEDLKRFRSKPRYTEEDEFSSVDSVSNQRAKCNPDSAYSSLNRKSPAQLTALDSGDRLVPIERLRLSSSGSDSSEQHLPPIPVGTVQGMRQDYMSPTLKQNYSPSPQDNTSPQQSVQKLSKFCHECGYKFPLTVAKFCCECGVKRLVI